MNDLERETDENLELIRMCITNFHSATVCVSSSYMLTPRFSSKADKLICFNLYIGG